MAIELDLDHPKYNCPLHYSFVITLHILFTHRLYLESSTQILYSNSNLSILLFHALWVPNCWPHFRRPITGTRPEKTLDHPPPNMDDHGGAYPQLFMDRATFYNRIVLGSLLSMKLWDPLHHFIQIWVSNYIGGNLVLTTLWWNFSLPTLWLPLVFLQSS